MRATAHCVSCTGRWYLLPVSVVSTAPQHTRPPDLLASPGNSGDVSSTLGELERKLRELEQELARVGHPAAAPAAPLVPAPPTPIAVAPSPVDEQAPPSVASIVAAAAAPPAAVPAPVAPAPVADGTDEADARLKALEEQLDALRHYGAELQDSAGRLLEAYRGALSEAEASASAPAPIPVPPAAPAVRAPSVAAAAEPAVRAPIHDERAQDEIMARFVAAQQAAAQAPAPAAPTPAVSPPAAPAPAPAPATQPAPPPPGPLAVNLAGVVPAPAAVSPNAVGAIDQRYVGAVAIDAGPFTDIASLSAFEQAIARVPGVRDVYVRGFQGQRAVIDVDLGTPTALVPELAAVTTVPFVVERADATGLVVTIPPVSPDAS
jgi:hypothetical protein